MLAEKGMPTHVNREGEPMGETGFLNWTDVSTSRWDVAVENLFGESLQLHRDHLLGDIATHRVIDKTTRVDHLRMIFQLFRLIDHIIGINPDTMATHQSWREMKEIPFRSRRLEHVIGIDAHTVENDGKLIH